MIGKKRYDEGRGRRQGLSTFGLRNILKSCKPARPLSPGKGEEKTCPFWAASRNSANVGGRSCASSQIGGHRTLCVHARCVVKVPRWKSGRMSSSEGARRPDWPDNGPSVRPAPLFSSCFSWPVYIYLDFYISLVSTWLLLIQDPLNIIQST